MTLELPLWVQADSYSARLDRFLIDQLLDEGALGTGQLAVSQRGAGANNTVDVAAGGCVIDGDDQANQGSYLCRSTAVVNVDLGAPPASLKRIDLVIARVNDPNAGGGAGSNFTIEAVTSGALSASPVAPATPATALVLAQVLRTTGDASITNAMVTDVRALAFVGEQQLYLPHTWTVPSEVKIASGDTDYIVPWFAYVPAGYTCELVAVRHRINGGTSVTAKVQIAGVDVAALTGLSITTTSTTSTPAAPIAVTDGQLIALVVTAVSATPKNMTFGLRMRYRKIAA